MLLSSVLSAITKSCNKLASCKQSRSSNDCHQLLRLATARGTCNKRATPLQFGVETKLSKTVCQDGASRLADTKDDKRSCISARRHKLCLVSLALQISLFCVIYRANHHLAITRDHMRHLRICVRFYDRNKLSQFHSYAL
jgi:hypothetical protein